MIRKLFGALIFTFFCINVLFSQSLKRQEIDFDSFILDLFGQPTEDARYDLVFENLFQYYRNPLNLNKATKQELENLFILSPIQINDFIKYRDENGDLLSEYELQAIPGFDQKTIDKLLPFVTVEERGIYVDNRSLLKKIINDNNSYLISRYQRILERQKGFIVSDNPAGQSFLGTPEALYTRYRSFQNGDYSIGFTAQKDIGEQITWNPSRKQYGLDFYSAHFAIYERGRLKQLNLGDYQMMIGQGLAMSAGFYIGKGAETVNTVKRSNQGIRPYTAALEAGFLRGAAARIGFGNLEIMPFVSYTRQDANIITEGSRTFNALGEESIGSASSILTSGLHRTAKELSNKGTLGETAGGIYALYQTPKKNLKVGVNAIYFQYDPAIRRNTNVASQFYFSGSQNYNLGVDYNYYWRNITLFGEYARNIVGANAVLNGVIASLNSNVDFAMLMRHYDPAFFSPYSNAFGEASVTRNEQGIYWGIKYTLNRVWSFAGFFDVFKYPWLSNKSDAPITGNEFLLRVNFKPTKKISMFAQYREENKPINKIANQTPFDYTEESKRANYMINLDYKVDNWVNLKSRVILTEFQQVGSPKETGFVIFQDLDFDINKKLKVSGRFAVFDAKDFNTRIYVYEKNVLWTFALPLYYGQGVREYIMLQYKVTRNLDIWLRLARFEYRNTTKISSGVNEIMGNSKTEATIQIKYDF